MRTVRIVPWILAPALALAVSVCACPVEAFAVWGLTTRASLGAAGVQATGNSSMAAISADGRYVAFSSSATNLVTGDANGQADIFVRDRATGTTTRVSVSSANVEADNMCYMPSISADGRYVAFYSMATNLVSNDTNGNSDVFVRDRVLNTTTRVSVDSSGTQANGSSSAPCISADGRYVAFQSGATNLVTGDTNALLDIFVHDRVTGVTTRESLGEWDAQGNVGSFQPSISRDGRYVVFESAATNLAYDSAGFSDIFLRDRVTRVTTLVSRSSAGVQGDGDSSTPEISADGRCIAFESAATNLAGADSAGFFDIFVRDRIAGVTTRESRGLLDALPNGSNRSPAISADGRRVVFYSTATNLVSSDTNGVGDIFMRDRVAGVVTRESVSSAGLQGDVLSTEPRVSGDGRYVAFESGATNLVASDTNGSSDIFVREAPAMTTWISIKTSATSVRTGAIPILSGAVTPVGMIGKNIVVWVKKPGKTYWTYSSNRTVYNLGGNAVWQYKYYFKPGMVKGYYLFKASVPAYPGYLASGLTPTTVSIRLR